ncbi:hypothetical protein LPUS_11350 [Lasallia pustulata]|uniref:Rhodopsin domain-containing protein n=1 Tax=Lasallia pustulata TaxID=136370 RepID=A0A1W5DC77_9LECA|nr:hypothetical protein LPUS_11350 [Lasallia pustulata]
MAVSDGLGQRGRNLSTVQQTNVEKAEYASDLMYVLTLCLAKVSVLQLLERLAVSKMHKTLAKVMSYVVVVWTLAAFFTLAFRCGVSHPWARVSGECIDDFSFWLGIAPVDILTELSMIALPILMMLPVQVVLSKKITILVAFIFRVLVILATILRLVCLHTAYLSSDFTFFSVNSAITTQCVLSLTIFTACIPCLKPFLDGFDSGMLGVGLRRRAPAGSSGNLYGLGDISNTKDSSMRSPIGHKEIKGMGYSGTIVAAETEESTCRREDSGSISSTKSDQMIIKRTDHWHVQDEQAIPQPTSRIDEEDSVIEPRKAVQSIF